MSKKVEREFSLGSVRALLAIDLNSFCVLFSLAILLHFFKVSSTNAQWNKIATFSYPVVTIYFTNTIANNSIGFVGLKAPNNVQTKLLRTIDTGNSWQQSSYPININGNFITPYCITFKNQLEGWFCGFAPNGIYHTLDGGVTWSLVSNISALGLSFSSFSNLLIGAGNGSYLSSNDGIAFTFVNIPGFIGGVSIAMNDKYGVLTGYGNTTNWMSTSDGGNSWNTITIPYSEAYTPIGVLGTSIFYAICELALDDSHHGKVIRSNDGGITWQELYHYQSSNPAPVTGTIQLGKDGYLFFQTTPSETAGIMMSQDSGITFASICGPTNGQDTRFYVRDTFIYAGDAFGGLWLNTTGIGSNSTPQLSKNNILFTSELCNVVEDTLAFTLFDSCNGRQATLLEASVSGSNRFSVTSGAVPRTIVPNDTVRIIYTPDPNSSATDNATLNLKLKLGWKVFDTIITLTGRNITPHLDVALTPMLTANNLVAGKEAECSIFSSNRIQDRGLDKVTLDLIYDNDLLEVASITAQTGMSATFSAPIVTSGIARLPITITSNNMTIDSLLPMVSVKFRTYLTDTTLSTIELSSIQLNDDDTDYKNCTLSATGKSTTFTQASICGDSTIRSFMMTGKLIDILSIRPNPAKDHISIEVNALGKQSVVVEIFDALGNRQSQFASTLTVGNNVVTAPLSKFPSGAYIVRITAGTETTSARFIVN